MFGWFRRKTKQNDQPATSAPAHTAPGTSIRFDPHLVDQLKKDHRDLLAIYGEIKSAFDEKEYATVSKRLGDFRTGLQGHLLTENVRLYVYLDHQFASDATNANLIRGYRREMDGIGRTAMSFVKKYEEIGVDAELAAAFAEDFATIGKVLGERIRKEEEVLYPLYMPSH